MLPNPNARVRREPGGISADMAEARIEVMADGRVTGDGGHEVAGNPTLRESGKSNRLGYQNCGASVFNFYLPKLNEESVQRSWLEIRADNPEFTRKQRTASGVGMIGLGVYVATTK